MSSDAGLAFDEQVFEYSYFPGLVKVKLLNIINVNIYIYLCNKLCKDLHEEVSKRGLNPVEPMAILPTKIVHSVLQIIQNSIHYKIYSKNLSRIKNKGLLLAMLITGINQVSKMLDLLERSYEESDSYYLVSVDKKPLIINKCSPLELGNHLTIGLDPMHLVKNIDLLFQMI